MSDPTSQPVTQERIQRYAWGFAFPLIIHAAITNGIFDVLAGAALTLPELIAKTGSSERGVSALVEALTGMGLVLKEGDRYRLAEDTAKFLVSSKPSFTGGLMHHLTDQILPNWMHIGESVKSGKPVTSANQESSGAEFFEKFVEALMAMNFAAASVLGNTLATRFDGKPVRVLDLAAGSGVWGIGIAQAAPQAQITAVDFERVLGTTRRCVERFHLTDRYQFVAGNALQVDAGNSYDVVTLGHILHSEGAINSRLLLERVFHQLKPGGTVAIAEFLVNKDRTGPMNGVIFTLNMLVHTDEGTTYSFEELKDWLEAIGFINVRTLEAPAPSPLILADKPSA